MPSLRLFGRRTIFAGDDLRSYFIFHTVYKVVQFGLACSLLYVTVRDNKNQEIYERETAMNCSEENEKGDRATYVYVFFSIAVHTIALCCMLPMAHYSMMGTPTDQKPRKPLTVLCYFDVIGMNFLRCILFAIGVHDLDLLISYCNCMHDYPSVVVDSVSEALQYCTGEQTNTMAIYIALFVTHAIDLIIITLTVLYFTCCHERLFTNSNIEFISSERRCSIYLRCCVGCCSIFTCCLFGGRKAVVGDYANFSLLLANYVNGNGALDVTPSDIAVGLTMLKLVRKRDRLKTTHRLLKERSKISNEERVSSQNNKLNNENIDENENGIEVVGIVNENKETEIPSTSSLSTVPSEEIKEESKILSNAHPADINLINEGAHFMIYAQAAYTMVAYMLEHQVTGLASLTCRILYNWFTFDSSHRKESIEGDDIFHSEYTAFKAVSKLPDEDIIYANFIDDITEIPYMIVLDHEWKSVVLTIRGTITLESIVTDINVARHDLTNLGEECGFDSEGLYCHTGMLTTTEWLYRDLKKHEMLTKVLAENRSYKLRIIGHSLGAGVAAILSVLLRPKYPDLRCLAFSPPGCTMSENLADNVASFTTAYIVNDDIIARTSIQGFEALRDGILEMICRIKIPKSKVSKVCKKYDDETVDGLSKAIEHILYDKNEVKDSKFKHDIDKFHRFQNELREKCKENYNKLCPPGRLIHFFQTIDGKDDMYEHTARYAYRSVFETINISSTLISDHNSLGVKNKIERFAIDKFGLRPPFPPISSTLVVDNSNQLQHSTITLY